MNLILASGSNSYTRQETNKRYTLHAVRYYYFLDICSKSGITADKRHERFTLKGASAGRKHAEHRTSQASRPPQGFEHLRLLNLNLFRV
jgi:hypothetical protein